MAGLVMLGATMIYADNEKDKGADTGKNKTVVAKKAQTTCPVMGEAIDKKLFVDAEGKRIYVCCSGCVSTVKANPAKYIKILEDQGVTLEKAPAKKK